MACLNALRSELEILVELFNKKHKRFQITSWSLDELQCCFIDSAGKQHPINAYLTETYPISAPIWFSDTDDDNITNILADLTKTNGQDSQITNQIIILLRELCRIYNVTPPNEIYDLQTIELPSTSKYAIQMRQALANEGALGIESGAKAAVRIENDELGFEKATLRFEKTAEAVLRLVNAAEEALRTENAAEEALRIENAAEAALPAETAFATETMSETVIEQTCDSSTLLDNQDTTEEIDSDENDEMLEMSEEQTSSDTEGIDEEQKASLKKLEKIYRQKEVESPYISSLQATNRILKELRDLYRSDNYKNDMYGIEIVNDSIYHWKIFLKGVDVDSPLYQDLQLLKQKDGVDSITLSVTFGREYPYEPPFVRVVYPLINNGYVLNGGGLCMELLTIEGWNAAYTMEAVILQISTSLVMGKARIDFSTSDIWSKKKYTLENAKCDFQTLSRIHARRGWYTPPQKDG